MRVVVVLQIELLPKAFKGLFASCCLCYFMPFSSKHYCTVVPSDIDNVFFNTMDVAHSHSTCLALVSLFV